MVIMTGARDLMVCLTTFFICITFMPSVIAPSKEQSRMTASTQPM